jgi:hypothetical protein
MEVADVDAFDGLTKVMRGPMFREPPGDEGCICWKLRLGIK